MEITLKRKNMNSNNFRMRIRVLIGKNTYKNAFKKEEQNKFANKIGVEMSTITNVLYESNEPSLELIERILLAFPKVNPDWLLFGLEPMFRETPTQTSKELCEPSAYRQFKNERNDLLIKKVSESESWEWTLQFIENYNAQLDWKSMSYNSELPWDRELIELYLDKWDWSGITFIILKMENKISDSSAQFVNYVLEQYADKLDWFILSKNKNIDKCFLSKYADYVDWNAISANHNLIWSREFIEAHSDQINWQVLSENSFYGSLDSRQEAFRSKILHLYGDRLDLFLLSSNYDLLFSSEIIEKYKERWDWHEMINNYRIEWTLEMFEKYDLYITKAVSPDELRDSYLIHLLMKSELQKYGLMI